MLNCYTSGEYLKENPGWHEADSAWKARHVIKFLKEHLPAPASICDIGCGAGEICRQVSDAFPASEVVGYDISPQAHAIAVKKTSDRLAFRLGEAWPDGRHFDLAMAIDVFEHVEDYFAFLRETRRKADNQLYNIPLDLSVQIVLRGGPLLRNWRDIGHIHVFTKDLALEALRSTGHQVVHWIYIGGATPSQSPRSKLLEIPRRALFHLDADLTVRVLGGYSVLALCR